MTKTFRRRMLTALGLGLLWPLAVLAQDLDDAEDAAGAQVSVEEVMAKPADWEGKEVVVRARVKSAAADEDKDFFLLIFDGGLRCRLAKAPIETKYSEMKVQCMSGARGVSVRLFHPAVKEARKTLFRTGEELEVSGIVTSKGSNRILLTEAKVVRYSWPKISGQYYDKYNQWHTYGLEDNHFHSSVTDDRNDAEQDADIDAATADAIMAAPADFNGKKMRVQGHIQRLEADGREGFLLILDDNLRCRMRKAEVENHYESGWQMVISKDGGAKLVVRSGSKILRQMVVFSKGDEIEVTGTVKQASSNRVLVEGTAIAAYKWPKR